MKKNVFLFVTMLSLVALVGCKKGNKPTDSTDTGAGTDTATETDTGTETGGETETGTDTDTGTEDTRPDYEIGDAKAEDGTGLMFSEVVGYNVKDASVIEENDSTRYIVYVTNETNKGKQVFAARKAVKEEGAWKYEEKHIIFRGNAAENAWDKEIFQPSVIKGTFAYNSTNYSYLMAYQGAADKSNYNNHIGLAVTNDILGEWVRVGDAPILENPEIYESSYGFGSPELVSHNKEGQAYLFYSFGETSLSGERVKTADFSNLNNIKLEEGYAELPTKGLTGRDDNIISNAGFALTEAGKLYIAGDGMPDASAPGCATSFEVASASLNILQSHLEEWESIGKVTGLDTMDDEKLGWDELFSPVFVRDAYGYINPAKLEVVYSTFDVDIADAAYTGQLCLYEVK